MDSLAQIIAQVASGQFGGQSLNVAHLGKYLRKSYEKHLKLAKLEEVPVVIKAISDEEVFKLALIENLQRSDLSPIEEAQGYKQLIKQENLTQDDSDKGVRKVNRVRAAIIKACLIRNFGRSKEEVTVSLNERRSDTAYNLGQVLLQIDSKPFLACR